MTVSNGDLRHVWRFSRGLPATTQRGRTGYAHRRALYTGDTQIIAHSSELQKADRAGDYLQVAAIATAAVFLTAENAKHAEEVVFELLCGLSGLCGKMWVITSDHGSVTDLGHVLA
jgi:hypothetical protein